MLLKISHLLFLIILFASCERADETAGYVHGEYINRNQNEFLFVAAVPERQAIAPYPWEEELPSKHAKITKEFFRCKGSTLNPARLVEDAKEPKRYHDCGGAEAHSLPLSEGKEFIYPILLTLLNELQKESGKKVFITSGHRCPEHNAYIDSSRTNQYSKHQLGAEVSFYIRGWENQPEKVIALLSAYYQKAAKYAGQKEYQEFLRWDKSTDVTTQPWYNKEIFVKLYKKNEGRNLDNRHPYPYVSIQVRYDYETREKVQYSWEKAFGNYMRW